MYPTIPTPQEYLSWKEELRNRFIRERQAKVADAINQIRVSINNQMIQGLDYVPIDSSIQIQCDELMVSLYEKELQKLIDEMREVGYSIGISDKGGIRKMYWSVTDDYCLPEKE